MDSHAWVGSANQDSAVIHPEFASGVSFETDIGSFTTGACRWRGSETILLVEDEALVRQAMGEALESAGYRVMIAEDAT